MPRSLLRRRNNFWLILARHAGTAALPVHNSRIDLSILILIGTSVTGISLSTPGSPILIVLLLAARRFIFAEFEHQINKILILVSGTHEPFTEPSTAWFVVALVVSK